MEKKHNILYVDDVKWPPASAIRMPYIIFWMSKEGLMEIFKGHRKSSGKLPQTGCRSSNVNSQQMNAKGAIQICETIGIAH